MLIGTKKENIKREEVLKTVAKEIMSIVPSSHPVTGSVTSDEARELLFKAVKRK